MAEFYTWMFFVMSMSNLGLLLWGRGGAAAAPYESSRTFLSFRNNYLWVYGLMMAGDSLQGPYVYALYQYYGFSEADIRRLFIAGFGSSMLFGTLFGAMADTQGRKAGALVYIATSSASCFMKRFPEFEMLMIGRVLGGVSTSLLCTVFESWLFTEHKKRGHDSDWLEHIISRKSILGATVAVLAGLAAHFLVEYVGVGHVAPFDLAVCVLVIGGFVIELTWDDNYGHSGSRRTLQGQIMDAVLCIRRSRKIWLLGGLQALFEGVLYVVVFLWTPALAPHGEGIPHGLVYTLFMLSCAGGAILGGHLLSRNRKPEQYLQWVFLVSAVSMCVPVMYYAYNDYFPTPVQDIKGMTFAGKLLFLSICTFEVCVGVFWPSMMSLRSKHLPDELRSTTMNCFRIPLNLLVCALLYSVRVVPLHFVFLTSSAVLLLGAWGCQQLVAAVISDPAQCRMTLLGHSPDEYNI